MNEGYMGVIQALGFQFAPLNWSYCNGNVIAISQNQALFALLGDIYGGDGHTSFGLPDLRGRTPMGQFQGPGLTNRVIGQRLGAETVTLTEAQMPAHTHTHSYAGSGPASAATLRVSTDPGTRAVPEDGDVIASVAGTNMYLPASDVTATVSLGGVSGGGSFDNSQFAIQNAGGSQPLPIMQPSLVVNFCICTQGIFPQRS
ncbi:phage tail protein [Oceanimonas sp. MB9]|uniref:phage tail protein n=1 Tax=Oceanimonas sp. MB9 TaxID=2588453 RepID=UPI0013F5FD8B|nr:tail fiber protein [Oceanimonas sp. MB9]NHI00433.1 hypothetical protein [Oceanimonas sp. MB9]